MMRYWLTILFALSMFSTVSADQLYRVRYSISTGIVIPESPERFGRVWNTGFNAGLGVVFQLQDAIQLQTCVDYHRLSLNRNNLFKEAGLDETNVSVKGGETSVLAVSAHAKIGLVPNRSRMSPYLVLGGGIFRFSVGDAIVSQQDHSETLPGKTNMAIGVGFGAGVDLALSERTILFVEGKYYTCFTDVNNTQYLPVRVGLLLH